MARSARDGAVHLLLVLAAVMVVVSYAENVNVAANEAPEYASWAEWAMDKASDAMQDVIGTSEYWADWAMGKFMGFGLGKEEVGQMATKAKETVSDITSGAEGSESAKEAYEVAKEKASDAVGDMGDDLRNSEIRDYDVDDEL